ncbi:MAG: hypothetical protein K0M40_11070 [Prolixibacteraceae bacterium]|nr:hypothetical protein [Prolixibacteraceae bacterium]
MKKFAFYLLLLIPYLTSGQLFPKLADFNGDIEKITEKRYGKEVSSAKGDSGIFKPGKYSGWVDIYLFDENSKLVKKTSTFQKTIRAEYFYESNTIGNKKIVRETTGENQSGQAVEYIEYENITDSEGKIQEVGFWSFNQQKNKRELFLVEKDVKYNNDQLSSFTRYNINENGEPDSGEKCTLFYDSSGRLIRIERKDNITNFNTILYYQYNDRGFVNHFSIDYMVGLRNDQNKQQQENYFKYDKRGNWTKRYWIADGKKLLEARRKIKYSLH